MLAKWIALLGLMATGASTAQVQFPKQGGVGLVPPEGMVVSQRFAGFEDAATGASILVAELPPQAYRAIAEGMSADALLAKGVVAGERREVVLEGAQHAFVVRGTQSLQGTDYDKWLLLAGSAHLTAIVTVQVPQEVDAYPDEVVDAALASVSLRAPGSLQEQIQGLPFVVQDRAGLRITRTLAGATLLLTQGDRDIFADGEQPSVVIAARLSDAPPVDGAAREALARRALATLPGMKAMDVEAVDVTPGRIDIDAQATASENGARLYVFQSVSFFADRYVRVVATCRAQARADWQPRFERLAHSVGLPAGR